MLTGITKTFQFVLNFAIAWGVILSLGLFFIKKNDKKISYSFALYVISKILSIILLTLSNYNISPNSILIVSILGIFPFLIGPFYYLYFGFTFGFINKWDNKKLLHFIIIPVSFIVILILHYIYGHRTNVTIFKIKFIIQMCFIAFYYIATFKNLLKIYRRNKNFIEVKLALIFTIAYSITCIIGIYSMLLTDIKLIITIITAAFAYDVFIIILNYLLAHRYPLLMAFYIPSKKINNDEQLSSLDIEHLEKKLIYKLEEEKLFLYEDLTLSMLANELNIQPYQLSQFLNNHLNKNFYSLINLYRIKEAKKILLEEPSRKIISIAFDVGFNSKQSFNRIFIKYTDMSPTQFRIACQDE